MIEYFKAELQGFYNHFSKHITSVLTIWLVCSGQLAVCFKLVIGRLFLSSEPGCNK